MDTDPNRSLYKEIMLAARETSRLRGSNQLLPGTMREAAQQKHASLGVFEDFEKWWRRVHTVGRSPISSSSNGVAPKPTNGGNETTFKGKFRRLVMQYDVLPPDEFLASEWGATKKTVGKRRSELKSEGFEFERRDGVYHVTKRPSPPPTPAPIASMPIVPVAVPQPQPQPVPVQGVLELTGDNSGPEIVSELREIKALLMDLLACWRQ